MGGSGLDRTEHFRKFCGSGLTRIQFFRNRTGLELKNFTVFSSLQSTTIASHPVLSLLCFSLDLGVFLFYLEFCFFFENLGFFILVKV